MPVAFPLSLRTIIRQGKSRSQPAAFRLAEPRRGYAYVQATGTDTPVFWDITLKFTQPEAALFQLWFTQDLQRGLLEFSLPIRTEFGLLTHTCRFLPDSLLSVQEDGEIFVYTATIMARAQIIPADALAQYSAAFSGPIPAQTSYAGTPYSAALAGYWTGGSGPFTYALVAGSLPTGIALNTSTGVLSGTTTAEDATANTGLIVRRLGAYGLSIDSNAFSFTASALAEPDDPDLDKLVLRLDGEGESGGTTVVDTSPSPKTLVNAGVVTSTERKRFGSSSLLFDGASSRLNLSVVPALKFGSSAFTVAGWIWVSDLAGKNRTIYSHAQDLTGGFAFFSFGVLSDGALYVTNQPATGGAGAKQIKSSAGAVPAGQWVHVEYGVSGSNAYLFVDGDLVDTDTAWPVYPDSLAQQISVGAIANGYIDGSTGMWAGNMDRLRIWIGVCKHTASFAPPSA